MLAFILLLAIAHAPVDPPRGKPDAIVDLGTEGGARLVAASWRYRDARLVEVAARAPGPDLKPSGKLLWSHEAWPKAGGADFDDSAWEAITAGSLEERRSAGKVSFAWYRTAVTLPERIGGVDIRGATVAFEIVIDDYAEVWVDGKLPAVLGDSGGQVVKGFNAPNRIVLTRDARPGQRFQLAVFGINGPISTAPDNFIWVRSATLDVYRPRPAEQQTHGHVVRLDAALDAVVPPGALIEKLAEGFGFTEGPVWHPDGYLLFSDPNENTIYRYSPDGQVSIYRVKSGYKGVDIGDYKQPGSNGLTIDGQGRLTINEHGNRRVTRLEKNGVLTVLADRYQGKRLNSPNDLVYRSDGTRYFDVDARGDLFNGKVFFDMGGAPGEEALDGLKIDRAGNLFVSGPGGVWVLSPEGKHLGTIQVEQLPANLAWGDADGRTLYLTARTGLYRIRLGIGGVPPGREVVSR